MKHHELKTWRCYFEEVWAGNKPFEIRDDRDRAFQKGDTIIGVADDDNEAVFYHNDRFIGKLADPEFRTYFFNIWLSENSSRPELSRRLLGQK